MYKYYKIMWGLDTPARSDSDTVNCEINGTIEEVWGKDLFPDMDESAFCGMTEDAINAEAAERAREEEELELLMQSEDFKG